MNPGHLEIVFKFMDKCQINSFQRVCVLMADEMKIQETYEYDQKEDYLYKPDKVVQVIMARGPKLCSEIGMP